MKTRCNNPNSQYYDKYGGRGITYYTKWEFFENFIKDMKNMPDPSYSIERINVNGNYEPSNCKWIPVSEQGNNKSTTHYITYLSKTQNIAQWEKVLKFKTGTIKARLSYGWSEQKALTTPIKTNKYPKGIEKSKEGRFRVKRQIKGIRKTLYSGYDLFEACCIANRGTNGM